MGTIDKTNLKDAALEIEMRQPTHLSRFNHCLAILQVWHSYSEMRKGLLNSQIWHRTTYLESLLSALIKSTASRTGPENGQLVDRSSNSTSRGK
jgi:hypothetical protein